MKYDIVIIGSGLGGLLCANILSKEGYNVCLIEKNNRLGGSLQSFGRKGCFFNTGLNYTESLDDGQILNQYFKYFGLTGKIKLKRLDAQGFDIINLPSGRYPLAIGHQNLKERLLEFFPAEKQSLTKYLDTIKDICRSISLYSLSDKPFNLLECPSLGTGAADYIRSEIKNYTLQNVVAGNNLMYAGHDRKTPLMMHALISNSFIESSWRVVDGSNLMIDILAKNITGNGGTILKNARAVRFTSDNGSIRSVNLENGDEIEGRYFISNTHPVNILPMIGDLKVSGGFAQRVQNIEDTMGMFTLYLVFKKNSFPYMNHNFYHFKQENTWVAGEYDPSKWPQMYAMMHTATSKSDPYAESASVLTYMKFSELEKWKDTTTGKRGDEYLKFKEEKSRILLSEMEREFPGITSCVEAYYSSTPLTWRDYTGTRAGSAFGLLKDYNKPMESMVLPRTKIPNLFLTGQNTNMHGILGVTISSVVTCGEIINLQHLVKQIRNA